jgi:hypothetical protein
VNTVLSMATRKLHIIEVYAKRRPLVNEYGAQRNVLESYSAARTQVKNNEVHASLSARLPRHVRDYPPTPAGRMAGQARETSCNNNGSIVHKTLI